MMIGEIKSITTVKHLMDFLQKLKVGARSEPENLESESKYEGVIKAFSDVQWCDFTGGTIFLI